MSKPTPPNLPNAGGNPSGDDAVPIAELMNLGPVSARWLAEIGITDRAGLAAMGAAKAYAQVSLLHNGVNPVFLYALAGALVDTDWRDLPPEARDRLRAEAAAEGAL